MLKDADVEVDVVAQEANVAVAQCGHFLHRQLLINTLFATYHSKTP